jgi:hypothetical protein
MKHYMRNAFSPSLPNTWYNGSSVYVVLGNKERVGLLRRGTPVQAVRDNSLGETSRNAVLEWFLSGSIQWLYTGSAKEPINRVLVTFLMGLLVYRVSVSKKTRMRQLSLKGSGREVKGEERRMHKQLADRHTLRRTSLTALLLLQGVAGLLLSLWLLSQLLAPGRPIIVSGIGIFAGPAAGSALVVALASLLFAWLVWRPRPWVRQRVTLLELFSLAIGTVELLEPGINRGIPISRLLLAALILLVMYAMRGREALPTGRAV